MTLFEQVFQQIMNWLGEKFQKISVWIWNFLVDCWNELGIALMTALPEVIEACKKAIQRAIDKTPPCPLFS